MKVFCPEHKRSFLAPRKNPIRCENTAHLLGELCFAGAKTKASSSVWEYCCNCEHFWPSGLADEKCPVCDRQISIRYLCDQCFTFSLESDDSAPSKNFTITQDGGPDPSCPACLKIPASQELQPHECFDLGASFLTALEVCPVCNSSIRENVSFPTTADVYLRSKAVKTVKLDYELEMLVEAEDGDFVLLNNANQLILLPKSNSLASKEEFYEKYQDYFHCMSPAAGDIIVTKPATVESVGSGWKLAETGVLEVRAKEAFQSYVPPPPKTDDEDVTIEPSSEASPLCPHCGAAIDQEYAKGWGYCWHCGEPLKEKTGVAVQPLGPLVSRTSQQITEPALPASASPFRASMFETPPAAAAISKHSVGVILLVGFLALGIIAFFVWWILSSRQPDVVAADNAQVPNTTTYEAATPSPVVTPAARGADDEVVSMRKRIKDAAPSDRAQIVSDLRSLEQRYSSEYRFPYERAKLSITGVVAHDEAFAALVTAAERAISNNRADEMLSELTSEKDTYFWKTSRGHEEWNALLDALRTKDNTKLQNITAARKKAVGH